MCDFGTGNNNKLNWVLEDKQELIDIIETIYKGAKKGRGLVVSPKGERMPLETENPRSLTLIQIIRRDTGTKYALAWIVVTLVASNGCCPFYDTYE